MLAKRLLLLQENTTITRLSVSVAGGEMQTHLIIESLLSLSVVVDFPTFVLLLALANEGTAALGFVFVH